ncbi:MAG: isoleucine--tRNA ligase [Candidatus Margulisiibacteriota bacterium]
MEYKSTLNLPQTPFPIKFNAKDREPQLLGLWSGEKIYELIQKAGISGKGKYILHDGPPYPNGDIHLGHALNKILKDIVVKFRSMEGYCVPFVPGWDCHGLPIETQLLKELSVRRSSLSVYEFRQKCREYALRYVDTQREEFKRIGVFGRWDKPYLTLDPGYEAGVIELFGIMAEKGYIFKSLKPIHWCPSCETALAEAEIEYEDDESPSIFVKFDVIAAVDGPHADHLRHASFIIWTTTPWTLPSNVAIAVHPDFEYNMVEHDGEVYVIAKELVESSAKSMGWTSYKVIGSAKGADFEGIVCSHPFMDRDSVVVMDEFVTLETGTGCVHIAPGHGDEDFKVGLKYKLPIIMPVDAKGCFTNEVPFLEGIHVWKANPIVLETLKEKGALLSSEKMKHQYPHCWRCKKPVIFRATEQWFISVDHNDLRSKALAEIEKTKWFPSWGQNRITSMVEGRPDWCISRQRSWGIPIPAFYCKKCGTPNFKGEFNKAVLEMVRGNGTDSWFVKEAKDILPKGIKCEKCGAQEFEKETDIMDVWLESGSSHFAVLKSDENTFAWPADLYLEGSDQHRGWFQTSLLTSTAAFGKAPFKAVLTHGFTVDEKGKKMSKSLGNVVDPQQVVKEYGADVLRLWVASTDFRNDMAVSKNILKQINEGFTKIRNTCRFLLSNINSFDAKKDSAPYEDLLDIDKYILMKFEVLLDKLRRSYDDFEFHAVYHTLYGFCVNDLSAFYLDVIKDRLYCDGVTSKSRRAAQTACFEMLIGIVKAMAPILTFTAEDLYSYVEVPEKKASVFLEELPGKNPLYMNENIEKNWSRVLEIRGEAYKKIEMLRAAKEISRISECDIVISCEKSDFDILSRLADQLPQIFMVSSVSIKQAEGLDISASKTANVKCERCWRYLPDVGSDSGHPSLCKRCADVVKLD